MRELPPLPSNWQSLLDNRSIFEVERGGAGGEIEWLINGVQFDPTKVATSMTNGAGKRPLAQQKKGSFNLWEIRNGGGGWVHPFISTWRSTERSCATAGESMSRPTRGTPMTVRGRTSPRSTRASR
jgi:hypothetical protein